MKAFFLVVVFSIMTLSCSAQRGFKNIKERDGKVGIGTNKPDELLTVKGKIHTQEVLVDLQGAVAPDYVFEKYVTGFSALMPAYEMMSLEALELYILENKHLPNVPSAKELKENGMSLKEMNLLLLEKLEELTLHTITQQKEINALKERLKSLENN